MGFKFGLQTSYAVDSFKVIFPFALEHHAKAFEWFPDKKPDGAGFDIEDLSESNRKRIRNLAEQNNISLSLHVPMNANAYANGGRLILSHAFQLAQSINAKTVVMHIDLEHGKERFAQQLASILKVLPAYQIRLAIENIPTSTPADFNELFQKMHEIKTPNLKLLGMCFDMGHANLCPATSNDYIKYLDLLDASIPIFHVHLNENYGDKDAHLPLFTGPSKDTDVGIRMLIDRLEKRHFDGTLILEYWQTPPESLLKTIRKLYLMTQTSGH